MENITERVLDFNKDYPAERTLFKLETMAKNAFRFFRATNHIFYEDVLQPNSLPDSPAGWISGDLHLENFGTYKSDNRLVYFDMNDFDEAVLGPVLLEIVRMAAGILVAFNSLHIDEEKAIKMSELFVSAYARSLATGKPAYLEKQTADGILKSFLLAAEQRKPKHLLDQKTIDAKKGKQLSLAYKSHKKLEPDLRAAIIHHVTGWLQQDEHSPYNYKATDVVFRLAGAGSVGVNRFVVLLESLNNKGQKHLLLDMKQARPSSLLPWLEQPQPLWQHEAERVVVIQGRMQNRPPALLSTSLFRHEAYVMEEMQSADDKIDFKLIKRDYREMCRVISEMGALAAAAQLRSSGREGSAPADELIAFGRRPDWKAPVLELALKQAHLMNTYYLQFLKDHPQRLFKQYCKEHLTV